MLYSSNYGALLLGCLMNNTQLLFNPSYPLTKTDFDPEPVHRIIFIATCKLAEAGAGSVSEVEIDNYVKDYPAQYETLNDSNFLDFVPTVKELCSLESFELYYTTLRKFSLLRELKEDGYNIADYYDEMLDETEQMAKLNKWTIGEILTDIEFKSAKLRTKYDVKYVRNEIKAGKNVAERLEAFKKQPSFGALFQSGYLSTIWNGWCRGHLGLRGAPSGVGKAIPNDTIIPTPNGNKRVDEIKVGDYLYSREGKPTKVIGVFPQGQKEVWEIELKDGRKAKCCDEHLWTVYSRTRNKNNREVPTEYTVTQMVEKGIWSHKGYRFCVPMHKPIEKDKKKFFIPPYLMGLFLGDASLRSQPSNHVFSFSSPNKELPGIIADMMGWTYKRNSLRNYDWTFYNNGKLIHVEHVLKDYPELINTYSRTKFIPRDYLDGSIQQRFELLSGLLDTDGSINLKSGSISYFTTSEQLKTDIVELCYSLGMTVNVGMDVRENKRTCFGLKIHCDKELKATLFKYSPKKAIALSYAQTAKRQEHRDRIQIVSIKDLSYKTDMTCFLVDNDEHLFLMNDYIVTHNSRLAVADLTKVGAKEIWCSEINDFIVNDNYQSPTLFIATEQDIETEVEPMFWSAVSGVEYRSIKNGLCTPDEEKRVIKAGEIIADSNLHITSMPNFNTKSLNRKIKEMVECEGIGYCVFDYMEQQGDISQEYREVVGSAGRQDQVLLYLATELKTMAEDMNVGILTSQQLNDSWKSISYIDETSLSGGKSVKNKCDFGSIVLPTSYLRKDLKQIEPYFKRKGVGDNRQPLPNICEFIFKSRYGIYGDKRLKLWSYFDRGTFQRTDYFVTDDENNVLSDIRSTELGDF
nr:MAG TPA: DNA packaging protein [Herelleviridae sp.]